LREFCFDKVLGPNKTQADIFEQTKINFLCDKVIDGYHATIFAYGQTGTGKTFTMDGYKYTMDNKKNKQIIDETDKNNYGITPRAIEYLFERINEETEKKSRKYTVYCSYLQIYNEKIYDLLNPAMFTENISENNATGLKLRYKDGNFTVDNLFTFECKNAKGVFDLIKVGLQNRIVASHKLNQTSSRSHSILSMTVESVDTMNAVFFLMIIKKRMIM